MAAANLSPAVLSLADDLSQSVAFFTAARSRQVETPGSVRRMANGRLRVVRRAGRSSSVGVQAVSVTPAQQRTLEDWAGRVVLYRDSWGVKVYATYFVAGIVDHQDRQRRDVTLNLAEVTISEAK